MKRCSERETAARITGCGSHERGNYTRGWGNHKKNAALRAAFFGISLSTSRLPWFGSGFEVPTAITWRKITDDGTAAHVVHA